MQGLDILFYQHFPDFAISTPRSLDILQHPDLPIKVTVATAYLQYVTQTQVSVIIEDAYCSPFQGPIISV